MTIIRIWRPRRIRLWPMPQLWRPPCRRPWRRPLPLDPVEIEFAEWAFGQLVPLAGVQS